MTTVPRTAPEGGSKRLFAVLLHTLAIAVLANAFRLLEQPGPMVDFMASQYGGKANYLTICGLAISLAYFVVALVKDFTPPLGVLDVVKNALGIVAVPIEGLISVLYWGISTYDPQMMAPPGVELPPLFLDISLHALPAVFLWIDFLFLSPPFSRATSPWLISGVLTAAYTGWIEYGSTVNKYYPFLNDMTLTARLVFYACAAVVNVGLFHLANQIHLAVDSLTGKDTTRAEKQAEGKSR